MLLSFQLQRLALLQTKTRHLTNPTSRSTSEDPYWSNSAYLSNGFKLHTAGRPVNDKCEQRRLESEFSIGSDVTW